MHLVLATDAFGHVGGSETYLLTVAEHLQRLGHEVVIHAVQTGPVADLAITRGVPVIDDEDALPTACDAALTQDAGMAHALAARYPGMPQVFVAHSALHDMQLPPVVAGAPTTVVVLSDRVARRVAAGDRSFPVVHLRQPIDTQRFVPLGAPRERPLRALLLSNYQEEQHRRLLEQAWGPLGVELVIAGVRGTAVVDPFEQIADADIVVGKGRAILDAMACGRPAYVYDDFGTDGWVTAESFAAMEADGFAGQATGRVADAALLRGDLDAYDAAMGVVNRELVLMHNDARTHAHELVGILRELAPGDRSAATADGELARNVRLRWAADSELGYLRSLFGDLHTRLRQSEERAVLAAARAAESEERSALAAARAAESEERAALAAARATEADERATAASSDAAAARERLAAVLAQRRVQLGIAAGRSVDRVRRAVQR